MFKQFDTGPLFTPPSEKGTIVNPGWAGGANWAGASFDPETGTLYVPSMTSPIVVQLVKPNAERSNLLYARGGTQMPPTLDGLPLLKPPYGRVTAIDLNKGDTKWVARDRRRPAQSSAAEGPEPAARSARRFAMPRS